MRSERRRGVVLAMVLILGLLLSTAVLSFSHRSMMDGMISRNRDDAARAEALARGGINVAIGLILEDALRDADATRDGAAFAGETLDDVWVRIADTQLETPDGGILKLRIEDTGSRLNLNALVDYAKDDSGFADQSDAEEFMTDFLTKIIDEMELPPGERTYDDPRELARNLIDFIDPDDVRVGGRGDEDGYYQDQTPPYRAANHPLLSVDQIGMIEGFDRNLVKALSHYVTVYPLVAAQGINLNTAPPHVLTVVYHGTSAGRELMNASDVGRILKLREEGSIICDETEVDPDRCVALVEVVPEGSIYPAVRLPSSSSVFTVTAEARVGDSLRTLEAVIDRQSGNRPQVLLWRYR